MSDTGVPSSSDSRPRSSRQRYGRFVQDYRAGRIDEVLEASDKPRSLDGKGAPATAPRPNRKIKRRAYFREYIGWLWPYRYGVAFLFFLALIRAGMEMIEPLFMRRIIDGVLLNRTLDAVGKLHRLH